VLANDGSNAILNELRTVSTVAARLTP
jgi:hypothetical protein